MAKQSLRLEKPTYTSISNIFSNLGIRNPLASGTFDSRDISSIHTRARNAASSRKQNIDTRLKELRKAQQANVPIPSFKPPKISSKPVIDPKAIRAIVNSLFDSNSTTFKNPYSSTTQYGFESPVVPSSSFGKSGTGTLSGI